MVEDTGILSKKRKAEAQLYINDDHRDSFMASVNARDLHISHKHESMRKKKKQRMKGPIDLYNTKNAEEEDQDGKKAKIKQAIMKKASKMELQEKAYRAIAQWMYDAAIPFNAVNYPSFHVMVESIGQYGIGLKAPSLHEVQDLLLNNEVAKVRNSFLSYQNEWTKYGCSIMVDGWTDGKQTTLINFLVNSPMGTVFIESVDASEYSKTDFKMAEFLDGLVERIGEANVVQVVTNIASNYRLSGKFLEIKRPHLYWTPCAAHFLDLMLEDIMKIPYIRNTIKAAITLNGYIYVRPDVVNMLRSFKGERHFVRPAVTRSATTFLTLQRIYKHKINLRNMFTSEEWTKSEWAKEPAGKKVTGIVMATTFWANMVYILKILSPLIRVFRLVHGEKKLAMGYIYQAMDKAKEEIAKSFNNNGETYKEVFEIIDKCWESQIHQPLYAVGYYLNPKILYSNPNISQVDRVMMSLYKVLERLVPNQDEQYKIVSQLLLYQDAGGLFGTQMAIKHRKMKSLVEWWKSYGSSTPDLQNFAIKVLSLTCSAFGCERNWSIFKQVHDKQRNSLAQQHLNDLIFVKYNRALKHRYDIHTRIDSISLKDVDDNNEWLMGIMEEELEKDDNLTLNVVAESRVRDEKDDEDNVFEDEYQEDDGVENEEYYDATLDED